MDDNEKPVICPWCNEEMEKGTGEIIGKEGVREVEIFECWSCGAVKVVE